MRRAKEVAITVVEEGRRRKKEVAGKGTEEVLDMNTVAPKAKVTVWQRLRTLRRSGEERERYNKWRTVERVAAEDEGERGGTFQ